MQWMSRTIGTIQVRSKGTLVDQLDYPAGALREMVSNAIVHRSFRSADEMTKISVKAADLIVISNPGGVHPGVDQDKLGLSPMLRLATSPSCAFAKTSRPATGAESSNRWHREYHAQTVFAATRVASHRCS